MRITGCSLLLSLTAASGFVVQHPPLFGVASTALFSSIRPDASAAIRAAIEASNTYGTTSPEARVAWDVVEELDASDNTAAYSGSLAYELTEEELNNFLSYIPQQTPYFEKMKASVENMQNIKLSAPQSKAGEDSPELRAALENARQLSEMYGTTSPEAKVAWSEVEEIASSGTANAIGKRLDEDCLVETPDEACTALNELNRALNVNENNW